MTLDEPLQYKPETQPEIVCIIGSNKFFDTMLQVAEQLTLRHKIALLPGVNTNTTEVELNETSSSSLIYFTCTKSI